MCDNEIFLFVCLGFIVPLEIFSLIWRRHHYRWRAANLDPWSAFMAIEQWRFFSVPHLLWHGSSVYNDHLRGPVTLTPIAERYAVELSLLDNENMSLRIIIRSRSPHLMVFKITSNSVDSFRIFLSHSFQILLSFNISFKEILQKSWSLRNSRP